MLPLPPFGNIPPLPPHLPLMRLLASFRQARVPADIFVQAISQLELAPESNNVLQAVYAEQYNYIVATTTAFGMALPE